MQNLIKQLFLSILILNITLFANSEKVSLQLEWKHQFEFAGFYTAIEKGYYKDVGLEVEIREFQDGINISQDVINRKSTFGISSSALILERLKNKPVVLIASYYWFMDVHAYEEANFTKATMDWFIKDLATRSSDKLPFNIKRTNKSESQVW